MVFEAEYLRRVMLLFPFVIMTELPGDRLDVDNVGGQLKV
jgi:hypothetical protein